MDCFCGCGTKLRRGLMDLNLQASRLALELLAWDKARAAGQLEPPAAADAERLIARGADCYQRLLRTLHGEQGVYSIEEGESWLKDSHAERRDREYMTEKGGFFSHDKLRLTDEDEERLDRTRPELSFSARRREGAGGGDVEGQLRRLAALHAEGVLTDEELAAARARISGEG